MSDLMIAVFRTPAAARSAAEALAALQDTAGVESEDIAVVLRSTDGSVALDLLTRRDTGKPLGGGRWGATIALLFLDGALGQPAVVVNAGLDPRFVSQLPATLDNGAAAIVFRARKLGVDRVVATLSTRPGYLEAIHTRMTAATETALLAVHDALPQRVAALNMQEAGR